MNGKEFLTSAEFKSLQGGVDIAHSKLTLIPKESEESNIRHHLRAMGHYFLDEIEQGRTITEKSINFYIRQLELSGKI